MRELPVGLYWDDDEEVTKVEAPIPMCELVKIPLRKGEEE